MSDLLQMYHLKAIKNRYAFAFANDLLIYAKGNNTVTINKRYSINPQITFTLEGKNELRKYK